LADAVFTHQDGGMDIVDDATPQLGIFVQGLRQNIGVPLGGGQNGEVC